MTVAVERALLASVRADPSDWDRWRVLADWLLEQGDSRGERVLLAHRLAVEALSADERAALEHRARALEEERRAAWLLGWAPPEGAELSWRHGFLVGVGLRWNDDTLAVLDELVAHPVAALLTRLDLGEN